MKTYVNILRLRRGLKHLVNYLFFELPRGLDISLRSKKSGITLPGSNGYALTSKSALKNMLEGVALDGRSLLDIGCGKGGVVIYALELGCARAAGIEFEAFLHDTAVRNFSSLGLSDRCESFNVDARKFMSYADYDIYFMFNPFDRDIYAQVIQELVSQVAARGDWRERHLVCYGEANTLAIEESAFFALVREGRCPHRGNTFRVYKSVTLRGYE